MILLQYYTNTVNWLTWYSEIKIEWMKIVVVFGDLVIF